MKQRTFPISSVDGRYLEKTQELGLYLSEEALIYDRFIVELRYLQALQRTRLIADFSTSDYDRIEAIIARNPRDYSHMEKIAQSVKKIEGKTNHDVKAVEYYVQRILTANKLSHLKRYVHFALTSEDVTSNAVAIGLGMSLNKVTIPMIKKIRYVLDENAKQFHTLPMLSMTHGQAASPTTYGKELRIYQVQFKEFVKKFHSMSVCGKLNGASGNYNAHMAVFPSHPWFRFTQQFIETHLPKGCIEDYEEVQLRATLNTNQIEPHLAHAEIFHLMVRILSVVRNISRDYWQYISRSIVGQKKVLGEVGSSTMPHKVNPIDFENAIGNAKLAQTLFETLARELPISTMQRDLVDSTMQRATGTAFGHTLIALKSLFKGLNKVYPNVAIMEQELHQNPAILAEPIQTILRHTGEILNPYEVLKDFTRGKQLTMDEINSFIVSLDISKETKKMLHKLNVLEYIGMAEFLALE